MKYADVCRDIKSHYSIGNIAEIMREQMVTPEDIPAFIAGVSSVVKFLEKEAESRKEAV